MSNLETFQTDERFEALLSTVLKREDIQFSIKNVGLKEKIIKEKLSENSMKDSIWMRGSSTIKSIEDQQRKLSRIDKDVLKNITKYDEEKRGKPFLFQVLAFIGNFWIFYLFVISVLIYLWFIDNEPVRVLYQTVLSWTTGFWSSVIVLLALILIIYLVERLRRLLSRPNENYDLKIVTDTSAIRDNLKAKRNYDGLENELNELIELAENVIMNEGMITEIRLLINNEIEKSYALSIPDGLNSSGLAEVYQANHEIPTKSKKALLDLVEQMPGGSIGVAGPRGIGKTTLLRALCDGAKQSAKGKEVLSIWTSAPVEYASRDYFIYLFKTICSEVLKKKGIDPESFDDDQNLPTSENSRTAARRKSAGILLRNLTLLFLIISISSLALSYNLASSVSITNSQQNIENRQDFETKNPTLPESITEILGISPSKLFEIGVSGIVLSLILAFVANSFLSSANRELKKNRFLNLTSSTEKGDFENEARKHYEDMKFQQSFSTGWSGSLKIPVGIEGSVNEVISFSKKPRSLPEVVDIFKKFLEKLSNRYTIFIAIDELDKIYDDERAHKFINEIKAIFGVNGCFYFVSVSESAISAFERRGLPFRDAFDSAFDTMLNIDYLEKEFSFNILRRRIIGLPIPLLTFCHCVTGGLPRDLIRICRKILMTSLDKSTSNIQDLIHEISREELKLKFEATLKAMELRYPFLHDSDLLKSLIQIHKSLQVLPLPGKKTDLKKSAEMIKKFKTFASERLVDLEPPLQSEIKSLVYSLGVYTLFLEKTLIHFEKLKSEADWKKDANTSVFSQLSTLRQRISLNPWLTEAELRKI